MIKSLFLSRPLRGLYRAWWEKKYHVAANDVFLVSYPRSGNTWVRFMLLQARAGFDEGDFQSIEEIIPDMHHSRPWFRCARTNLVKSHLCHWQPFRRVVYLVRDGRAATWSNWRYQSDEGSFHGSFTDFLQQDTWPSSWGRHVEGWISAPETRLVIRYEDLLADPVPELQKIVALLGWPCNEDRLQRIAAEATRHRMKAMETQAHVCLHRVGSGDQAWRAAFSTNLEKSFLDVLPSVTRRFLTRL